MKLESIRVFSKGAVPAASENVVASPYVREAGPTPHRSIGAGGGSGPGSTRLRSGETSNGHSPD